MEILGQLTLRRFCGTSVFEVTSARITVSEDGRLCIFEIEETIPVAGQAVSDLEGAPSMQAIFHGEKLTLDGLLDNEITIPKGYDDELGDHVAHFQLPECEEMDNNVIRIVELRENRMLVRWAASTQDPNFYDGSKPPATIECETWMVTDDPTTIAE